MSHKIIKSVEKLIDQETSLRNGLINNDHDPSSANEVLALLDLILLALLAQHHMLAEKALVMISSDGRSLH